MYSLVVNVVLHPVGTEHVHVSPQRTGVVPCHFKAVKRGKAPRLVVLVGNVYLTVVQLVGYIVRVLGQREEINAADVARIRHGLIRRCGAVRERRVRMNLAVIQLQLVRAAYRKLYFAVGLVPFLIAQHDLVAVRAVAQRTRRRVAHATSLPMRLLGHVFSVDAKHRRRKVHARRVAEADGECGCSRVVVTVAALGERARDERPAAVAQASGQRLGTAAEHRPPNAIVDVYGVAQPVERENIALRQHGGPHTVRLVRIVAAQPAVGELEINICVDDKAAVNNKIQTGKGARRIDCHIGIERHDCRALAADNRSSLPAVENSGGHARLVVYADSDCRAAHVDSPERRISDRRIAVAVVGQIVHHAKDRHLKSVFGLGLARRDNQCRCLVLDWQAVHPLERHIRAARLVKAARLNGNQAEVRARQVKRGLREVCHRGLDKALAAEPLGVSGLMVLWQQRPYRRDLAGSERRSPRRLGEIQRADVVPCCRRRAVVGHEFVVVQIDRRGRGVHNLNKQRQPSTLWARKKLGHAQRRHYADRRNLDTIFLTRSVAALEVITHLVGGFQHFSRNTCGIYHKSTVIRFIRCAARHADARVSLTIPKQEADFAADIAACAGNAHAPRLPPDYKSGDGVIKFHFFHTYYVNR